MIKINDLMYVTRCKKSEGDERYKTIHGAVGDNTICGKELGPMWWIESTSQFTPKSINCVECRKLLKKNGIFDKPPSYKTEVENLLNKWVKDENRTGDIINCLLEFFINNEDWVKNNFIVFAKKLKGIVNNVS